MLSLSASLSEGILRRVAFMLQGEIKKAYHRLALQLHPGTIFAARVLTIGCETIQFPGPGEATIGVARA